MQLVGGVIGRMALLLLFATSSSYAGPLGYKQGRWVYKIKESYFSTNANYDSLGGIRDLSDNRSLTTYTTSLSTTWDAGESSSLFAILDLPYGKSVGYDFQRTRFSMSDFKLGFDFALLSGSFNLIPELMFTAPIEHVKDDTDNMIISEGVFEGRAGLYAVQHFDQFSMYAYGGYAHRDGGRSALVPYEFQFLKLFGDFQITGGINGFFAATDDKYVLNPGQRGTVTTRVNGGSLRFYAVNPSLMDAGGSLGFSISNANFLRIGASRTVLGTNSAVGTTYWVSFSYSGGSTSRAEYRETKVKTLKVEEKKKQEFVPEHYDEERTVFDEAVKDVQKDSPQRDEDEPADNDQVNMKNTPNHVGVKLRRAKPTGSQSKPSKKKKPNR